MSKPKDIKGAVDDLYAACERLASCGFVLTGGIFIVKPKGDFKQKGMKHVSPDNRVGMVRILPPTGMKPIADLSQIEMTPINAAVAMTSAAIVAGAPTMPGKTGTGEICKNCGGSNFRRMGTCLYCEDCGESNGCS